MARRKQSRPRRGNEEYVSRDQSYVEDQAPPEDGAYPEEGEASQLKKRSRKNISPRPEDIPWTSMIIPDLFGKQVAEIHLLNTSSTTVFEIEKANGCKNTFDGSPFRLRLQLRNVAKTQVGGLQHVSSSDMRVEILMYSKATIEGDVSSSCTASTGHADGRVSNPEEVKVLVSGEIDGPDAALSALSYLIRQEYVSLKAGPCLICGSSPCVEHGVSNRLRVLISDKVLTSPDECMRRPLWKKAMQTIMSWLRPELNSASVLESSLQKIKMENHEGDPDSKQHSFDPAALYAAVKPSRTECPEMSFPQLLTVLRPYQRRAAFWMVLRERGLGKQMRSLPGNECTPGAFASQFSASTSTSARWNIDEHPLWLLVSPIDGTSEFYYNSLSGAVSLVPRDFVCYVRGGILADEMGLGKTVELLACILANPHTELPTPSPSERARKELHNLLESRKHERVECACGSVEEEEDYEHAWVQCDTCDAWQHSTCVGFMKAGEHLVGQKNAHWKGAKGSGGRMSNGRGPSAILSSSKRLRTRKEGPKQNGVDGLCGCTIAQTEEKFVCGSCAELIGKVQVDGASGATLVVCPTPILQQWQDEILRHTKPGSLEIIVYEGVGKGANILRSATETGILGSRRLKIVSAHDLASADIVLTTYDTLRSDLFHDSDKTKTGQRSLRYIKRFPVIPTPLTRLRWWRICLDEAQMVESSTARATEMALLLDAENRWCVSGTPIQRGLDDLFGLLKFLQAKPFDEYQHWSQALQQPYEAGVVWAINYMHKYIGTIMWRSSKTDVKDELNLPTQTESLTWLRFSPVEAHFYRQQHEKCAVKAREVINKYRTQLERTNTVLVKGSSRVPSLARDVVEAGRDLNAEHVAADMVQMDRPTHQNSHEGKNLTYPLTTEDKINRLLMQEIDRPLSQTEASLLSNSLLKLRQACCHPQVGSAGIRSLQQRTPMTMDEILQVLVDKAKVEAEEAQRVLIGALNGLAALAIIENDYTLAISIYREALSLTEENAADVLVDPLQKLHTLHNLADILGTPNLPRPNVPRTLRDGLLMKQCADIKSKYMGSFLAKHIAGREDFRKGHQQVVEAEGACEASGGPNWWLEVLLAYEKRGDKGQELVQKIRNHFLDTAHSKRGRHDNASSLALRFRDISGLKYVLQSELTAISTARMNVIEGLSKLEGIMENTTVEDAERHANCPRHSNEDGPVCSHCEMDDLFQVYENRLLLLRTLAGKADGLVSAEEAVIAQHRIVAHKRISGSKDQSSATGMNEHGDMDDVVGRSRRDSGATEAEVLRAPSETEHILSIIKAHARFVGDSQQRDAATKHLQTFEFMKKEYAQMRTWVRVQREVLHALDELNMATIRLGLQVPGEKIETEIEKLVKVHPEEVPQRNVQLTSEKFDAEKDFSRAKGQLRYLKGLSLARRQAEDSKKLPSRAALGKSSEVEGWGKEEEECCPVCQDKLDSQLMVLPCGHMLCCKCCMLIIDRAPSPPSGRVKSINCPSCRKKTSVGDIALVDNGSSRDAFATRLGQLPGDVRDNEEASLEVSGSYGTKIEAVVRRMLWVRLKDSSAKVLVFSTWHDVLDVFEHALQANRITYARVKGRNLDVALKKFRGLSKSPVEDSQDKRGATEENVQVLLLPVQQGGNGLNLVEAQHVFLVEPLPNPAIEAQAINRVHRIGQSRPTFVHRFIVSETVEESVYWLGRTKVERVPGSGMGSRKRDRYSLTLNEVSALFAPDITKDEPAEPQPTSSLRDLPPAEAAASAAEARRCASLLSQQDHGS